VKILLGLLATDLALYWVHRAMHASPTLWRTHVFHHSIEDLYWLSGARTSVTHLLLFAAPQVILAWYVFGLTTGEAAIAFSIGVVVNLWVHTNLRATLGPLDWLVITPAFHRIHHGRDVIPSKNLAFLFTLWDRLFGTYEDPRRAPAEYPLGLARPEDGLTRMVVGW
jgi:sterol desaturase/sphingolipid hydroxylase (fatty acid hydroxylase superfamily)